MKQIIILVSLILLSLIQLRNYCSEQPHLDASDKSLRLTCPDFIAVNNSISGNLKVNLQDAFAKGIDQNRYSSAVENIMNEEYNISYSEELKTYQSSNRANNLRFIYHKDGFSAKPRETKLPQFDVNDRIMPYRYRKYKETDDWSVKLKLVNVISTIDNKNAGDLSEGDALRYDENRAWFENENIRIEYTNTKHGMRQDFIIKNKPAENENLELLINAETELRMKVRKDAVKFVSTEGTERIRYSSLKVFDSNGNILDGHFEKRSDEQFAILVYDKDAKYPVTVDPVSSTPDWSGESNQSFAEYGFWTGAAGDVNGDGYSDVIVGASHFDNGETNEGRAYLYYGSASGLSLSPDWVSEVNQAYCYYGCCVGTAGDVNGDGYSDVFVGALRYDNGEIDEGRIYVYYGSSSGLAATPDWIAENNQAESLFGYRASTAGDVNGDGFSDFIVSAVEFDNGETDEGRVYAYFGSASGLSASPDWIVESNQESCEFGISLSCAGDVNSDGYSDIIIGALGYDNPEPHEGKVFGFYGSSTGLPAAPNWTFECNMPYAYLGWRVSTAGDVNGDGYDDVIAGAPYYSLRKGRVFAFYGSPTGLPALPDWIADSDQAESEFGGALSTAGDVNGDGYSDIIAGACLYSSPEYKEGRAYIYLGSQTGLVSSPEWIMESNQELAEFGVSVSTCGDVNGDGISDVIVGAYRYSNGQELEGKAFVYYGYHDIPLPVELNGFSAQLSERIVKLIWSTSSELNNSGFDIERAVINGEWRKVGFVAGNGTTNQQQQYSFTERNLETGKYIYRLKQIDFNGNYQYYGLTEIIRIGIPDKYELCQNYPNPFNPVTTINYDLPKDGIVTIKVYDILGREVKTLVDEMKTAGYHKIIFNASDFASGAYFYRMTAGDFSKVKKFIILK